MTEPGWMVLDPNGVVVASGGPTMLEMVSNFGEGVDDGGNRPGNGVEDPEFDDQ